MYEPHGLRPISRYCRHLGGWGASPRAHPAASVRLTLLVTALVWIMRAMRCKFLRKILHNIHRAIITLTVVVLPVSIAILVSVAGLGPISRSFVGFICSFSVNHGDSSMDCHEYMNVRLVVWRPDKVNLFRKFPRFQRYGDSSY